MQERAANWEAGLGNITDAEKTGQQAVNLKAGRGEVTDAEHKAKKVPFWPPSPAFAVRAAHARSFATSLSLNPTQPNPTQPNPT